MAKTPRTPKAAKRGRTKRGTPAPKPAETAPDFIQKAAAGIAKAEKERKADAKRKSAADRAEGRKHSIDRLAEERALPSRTPKPIDLTGMDADAAMAALAKAHGIKWTPPKKAPPKAAAPKVRGRPSDFTPEVADYILGEMATGRTVSSICAGGYEDDDEGKRCAPGVALLEDGSSIYLPSDRTVRRWAITNEYFRPLYARARELQAHAWFEQTIDIADDGSRDYAPPDDSGFQAVDYDHIQRSKLRVDTRKWATGKLLPREYGDRVKVDLPRDPLDEKNNEQLQQHALDLIAKLRRLGVPLDGLPNTGSEPTGGGDPGVAAGASAHAG